MLQSSVSLLSAGTIRWQISGPVIWHRRALLIPPKPAQNFSRFRVNDGETVTYGEWHAEQDGTGRSRLPFLWGLFLLLSVCGAASSEPTSVSRKSWKQRWSYWNAWAALLPVKKCSKCRSTVCALLTAKVLKPHLRFNIISRNETDSERKLYLFWNCILEMFGIFQYPHELKIFNCTIAIVYFCKITSACRELKRLNSHFISEQTGEAFYISVVFSVASSYVANRVCVYKAHADEAFQVENVSWCDSVFKCWYFMLHCNVL